MSARDGGQEATRCGPRDRRPGGWHRSGGRSGAAVAGPAHRRAEAARGPAAARSSPNQRGAELRQPADGADRRDDRRRPLGEPQHLVPAASATGGSLPHQGRVGAPGATVAPLLLAHRGRPHRIRAAGRGGTAFPRLGEVVDRRDHRRGLRTVRTARAGAGVPLSPTAALALWSDVERWPTFVEGFARRLELAPEWPAKGARVVWESKPEGRGRVTETVLENSEAAFSTQVFEEALMGTQAVRAVPAGTGSHVELTIDYELAKYGPLAGVADAIFIRRALRDALRRTLFRFRVEAEEEASLRH